MCSDLLIKDGVKDSCSENFVMFAGKCLWEIYWKKLHYVESQFLLVEALQLISKKFTKCSSWLTEQIWVAKCDYGRINKCWILLFRHWKLFFLSSIWSCRQEYLTANLFVCFILQFTVSWLGSTLKLAPPTENVC